MPLGTSYGLKRITSSPSQSRRGGHYGTVKAHADRWKKFVVWCRSEDDPKFNDGRQIDQQVLADYAAYVRGQVERGELGDHLLSNSIPPNAITS